jgi:hypothetical protein
VRLGSAEVKAGAQCFDLRLWERSKLAPRTTHNGHNSWHFQHLHAFAEVDADKNVTGKEREIQRNY